MTVGGGGWSVFFWFRVFWFSVNLIGEIVVVYFIFLFLVYFCKLKFIYKTILIYE